MSALPPPPLQAWRDMPAVWQRWFIALFGRLGETSSSGIGELDELIASGAIGDDISGIYDGFADLERSLSHNYGSAEIDELRSRIDALERLISAET